MKFDRFFILGVYFLTSILTRGEVLEVKVLPKMEEGGKAKPVISVINAKVGEKPYALSRIKNSENSYYINNIDILDDLGKNSVTVEMGCDLVGAPGRMIFDPERTTLNRVSEANVVARLYDNSTYYGVLVEDSAKAQRLASGLDGTARAEKLALFFSKLEEAFILLNNRDTNYHIRYTSGLCDLVKWTHKTPESEQLVIDWFAWACRDWHKEDSQGAERQLGRVTEGISQAKDPAWRFWMYGLLKQAYSDGFAPSDGTDSLCDQLNADKKFEAAFDLAVLEMESGKALGIKKMKWWAGCVQQSLRGMTGAEKNESLNRFRMLMGDEIAPGDKEFRARILKELDVIAAGG